MDSLKRRRKAPPQAFTELRARVETLEAAMQECSCSEVSGCCHQRIFLDGWLTRSASAKPIRIRRSQVSHASMWSLWLRRPSDRSQSVVPRLLGAFHRMSGRSRSIADAWTRAPSARYGLALETS
jgi:hypothetical protein